jgi:hypothetical protein
VLVQSADYIVGMSREIADADAIAFVGFYRGLARQTTSAALFAWAVTR